MWRPDVHLITQFILTSIIGAGLALACSCRPIISEESNLAQSEPAIIQACDAVELSQQ